MLPIVDISRRRLLMSAAASVAMSGLRAEDLPARRPVIGGIGITTGSFTRHLTETPAPGKLVLLDLPRIMANDLGLTILDLMTATIPSWEPAYLDRLRNQADKAGCIITNLKLNQPGLDLGSLDDQVRDHALAEYAKTIVAAARLGCRWVRPLPGPKRPDLNRLKVSYQRLMEIADQHQIGVLIENFGWMQNDPDAIPTLIAAIGPKLRAQPDTGNWTDEARYAGLEKAFPHAVSCDFKARELDPAGEHAAYDLHRCFRIGWRAGFRGPWCFEHVHPQLDPLLRDMIRLKEMIQRWIKEESQAP